MSKSDTDNSVRSPDGEYIDCDIKKVDYTVEYEGGPDATIHVLARTGGGTRVHVKDSSPRPYFYLPNEEFDADIKGDDKVVGYEKGHEDIKGDHVVKVYTRIPGDVPKVRDGYTHLEADILWPNRVMIDCGISGSIRLPKEHVSPEPTEVSLKDLDSPSKNEDTRICFCDIEVDDSKGFPDQEKAQRDVTCITAYDSFRGEYVVYLYHPSMPEVSHEYAKVNIYTDEARMLRSFCKYIVDRDFDAITGWNFDDFDSRYLINRLDNLSDDGDVDIHKNDISKLDSAYDDGWFGAKIKGMAVVDLLRAYQNLQFSDLDSYSLEDVAQEELDTGKITDNRDLHVLWDEDPQKLVDYNVKDVELTVKLDEKLEIIKFYEEIANYVGGRTAEVVDASKAVDIKVLRAVNGEYAVPSAGNVETEEFEGAKVFDPITGVKENVVVLDLKSLYPMSMKTINAGPETKDPDGDLVAPNGVRFNNDKHAVVVEIIDEMLEERQQYKDLRDQYPADSEQYAIYDRKQTAVKVVMNTLYGVMGWDRFRLQDRDVGAAVTAVGREVIKFTEQVVEEMGYQSVYGDTDSVMIQIDDVDQDIINDSDAVQRALDEHDVDSVQQLRDIVEDKRGSMSDAEFNKFFAVLVIGFEMESRINARYDEFAKRELNADEHFFQIEFEKLYRRFFQAGKKKRYAGNITWKENKVKDSIDIVGFEYKRSDYSKVAKNLMKDVFNSILKGGSLEDISSDVNDTIDRLKSVDYDPDNFGIPASVTKNFDEYDNPTLAVKGSKYSNEQFDAGIQPGDKPKMNYVKRILPDDSGEVNYPMPDSDIEKSQPCCWMSFQDIPDVVDWDWDKYISVQIKSPLERILQGTDWTWGEVISGNRQPKLSEYSFEDEASEKGANTVAMQKPEDTDSNSDDFDSVSDSDVDMSEAEARNKLSEAQELLDGWESSNDGDPVKIDSIELDDGPSTLDDFM